MYFKHFRRNFSRPSGYAYITESMICKMGTVGLFTVFRNIKNSLFLICTHNIMVKITFFVQNFRML